MKHLNYNTFFLNSTAAVHATLITVITDVKNRTVPFNCFLIDVTVSLIISVL